MAASLLTQDNIGATLRIGTLACSGIWYGASQYVSCVEVPARRNLPTAEQMVDHFQNTFPRAKAFQGGLAILGGIDGVAQYFLDKNHPGAKLLLGSGLILLGLWPYTLAVIMPINNQLMNGEEPKKKGESWVKEMVEKWANVHFVRTVAGGVAFGLCIKAFMTK